MVSLDINLSSTNNGKLVNRHKANESFHQTAPGPGPAPGPAPNPDAETNEIEIAQQNEYEDEDDDEDEVNELNVGEISKDTTFGHNFEIDISKIYPIKRKNHMILDIKRTNEKCFLFCVAAGLKHRDFKERPDKENPKNYEQFIDQEFDISGIEFPIKISQIQQFVNQNSHHRLSINIYTVLDGQVKTVKSNITHEKSENANIIDLLAVFPHSTENASSRLQDGHFMLISNPCKFFFAKKQNSNIYRLRQRIVCPKCKMQFSSLSSAKYKNHKHFCSNQYAQVQDMPSEDYRLSFGKLNIFLLQSVSSNVNFNKSHVLFIA